MSKHEDAMHEALRPYYLEFMESARDAGLDLVTVSIWRDPEYQRRLYAQGRTKPGKIVTWAKPGTSPHNFTVAGKPASLAFDVCPRELLKLKDWAPKDDRWAVIGERARRISSLTWGGDFPAGKVDRPHIQLKNWKKIAGLV